MFDFQDSGFRGLGLKILGVDDLLVGVFDFLLCFSCLDFWRTRLSKDKTQRVLGFRASPQKHPYSHSLHLWQWMFMDVPVPKEHEHSKGFRVWGLGYGFRV